MPRVGTQMAVHQSWTPLRPSLVLALLLAVVLSWGGPQTQAAKISADSGWVPVSGSTVTTHHRGQSAETPRYGSRITKHQQRSPRVETTTAASTTRAVTTPTPPKPNPTSKARPIRQERPANTPSSGDDEEETKSLAQQVAEGKYGLIQNELFSSGAPVRPGILSYTANLEVPRDTADNLGGLRPDEIWLSEGHVLVLSGGNLGSEGHWEPIDNYQAPPRQVKIPPNPSVPPPFPIQLQDGGPTGFVTSNGTLPFKYGPPPPGNFEPGNGIIPPYQNQPPFPHPNGSKLPPLAPPQLFRQENLTQDDDDPSIFYPPPYDFSYQQDNSSVVPPGPLVPGIVLPPPPNFFAPVNNSAVPQLFVPPGPYGELEPPPQRPPYPQDVFPPEDVLTNVITQAPPEENEIVMPDYPYKEPNVYLHHHGSPLFATKNVTPTRVQVSAPEKLIVYELPGVPPLPRGRTIVSSTPSPTALYYTLPPEPPIKLTIYSATPAPAPPKVKQHHTQTFFANAPKPRPFTSPKPPAFHTYFEIPTSTPEPVHLYPDTTPTPPKTTPAPTRTTSKPVKVTTEAPSFFPSSLAYDLPSKFVTTTPAPSPVPKGRYLPFRDDYYYDVTPAPPRYVPPQRPIARPEFDYFYNQPPRRPEPVYYNPRPNPGYYYPPQQQQQRRPIYQTPAPAYDNIFYQSPTHRPAPRPEVGFYYPPPQRNQQSVVQTTQNPIFNGLYTHHEEKFMDDITKGYFNAFGQRLTTPLPPLAPTEAIPKPISLHGDTRVNYRRPLPPINPDSEFVDVRNGGRDPSVVAYQLPGQGQRGPSHYFFLTPRYAPGDRVAREEENIRPPRSNAATVTTAPRPPVSRKQK
ncbi:hypothetical protein B566_EDAN001243 [Ephemera danica]|nr:hypothetical protein B566_EDAN001243 [Ephemera danica]